MNRPFRSIARIAGGVTVSANGRHILGPMITGVE